MRRFRQVFAGLAALVSLTALFFVILRWRVEAPEDHLVFGQIIANQPPGQKQQ